MKNVLKKLVEVVAMAIVPVIVDWAKELLDDLKKKVEPQKEKE